MYNGILPVFKERGLTSHDVVFKLRKILNTKKIGHTGTLDPEVDGVLGEAVEHKSITETDLTEQQVDHVIKQFEGTIEQIPPMYSSVKVNGKRLYEYARNNETVERPIRQAIIKNIKRISPLHFDGEECHFDIAVSCGKGTYIRTLATDIGAKLGYPAHMSLLTRIESGGFNLEQSLSLEDIKNLHEHDSLQDKLFPIE